MSRRMKREGEDRILLSHSLVIDHGISHIVRHGKGRARLRSLRLKMLDVLTGCLPAVKLKDN